MANLFQPSLNRVTDSNGDPVPNARMYFYLTGTTTPATWYTDQAETTPGTNPLTADSSGKFTTPAYLSDTTTYRVRVTDASGTQLWPDADPVRGYDTGMVQTAAEQALGAVADAEAQVALATTQAGIATTQAGLSATARAGSEAAQGLAEDARDAAEVFRDEAEEQADLATTAVTLLPIQTNPATPTTPPSGVSSGEQYWAVDADATKLTRYLNTSGTGATISVGGKPLEAPLKPTIDAVLEPVASAAVAGTRTLTEADARKTLLVNIPVPTDDVVASLKLPSNSEEALAVGTTFKLLRTGGAPVRLVSDDAGDATVLGAERELSGDDALAYAEKVGTDDWRFYGDVQTASGELLDPGTHKILFDITDFDTLFEDAAGTVPFGGSVGDTVCYIANKGTLGGGFAAPSDVRGYTLEIIDGAYALVRAASNSCLIFSGATGNLNLAQIDLFLGIKTGTHVQNNGILLFQSATVGDTNKNDGGFVYMGANQGDLAWRMGSPAMLPEAPGSIPKYPHVLELYKPGNSATGYLSVDNQFDVSVMNPSATVTSLTTMAGALIFAARSANSPPLNLGNFGDVAFFGMVGGDAILTTDQRNAARAWMESRTYGTVPRYPALNTLADVTAARNVLIDEVFGGSGIPSTLGTMATDGSPPITGLTNLASVEKMTPGSYALRPRVFTPNSARTDVVVLIWNGHSTAMGAYAINTLTQQLLTANVTVVNMVLPSGSNDYTSGSPPQHYAATPGYDEWVGPFCIAVNTMRNRYPGAKIIVTGISGGGWASLMSAAVDARVSTNISVVGWLPEHIHQNRDYEQLLDDISGGYMNLALIAAADGRRNICRLHSLDAVGFGAAVYNQRPDAFAGLSTRATALGGYFAVSIEAVSSHSYSTNDRALVLAELP